MFIFIFQCLLVLSLGGLMLLSARKIPALVVLPVQVRQRDAQSGSSSKKRISLKTKLNFVKQTIRGRDSDFVKAQSKAEQIDQDQDYWQKIRQG